LFSYQTVDRLPVVALEPYEGAGLERWRREEGLPADQAPEACLGMDRLEKAPVNYGPLPLFETQILSEDATYYVERDGMGATVRRRKDAPGMYYGYIEHPIKTREDWEQYKWRYDPHTPGRLPENLDQVCAELNASENPVGLDLFPCFFRLGFYLMGMERFLTAFHDEPDLMQDMFGFWAEFLLQTVRPLLGKLYLDYVTFAEDLAYKGGPHISPKTYAEFWLPHQDPLVEALRRSGVPVICLWSAGDVRPLLPLLRQHGFNCTWPLERGAGMDPVALRKAYGPELRLGGGLSKEALIAGPEAIDREIDQLMPLISAGGYLPALDDMVPPEVSLANYRHLVRRLQEIQL
jgi:uroporphyrinogen decarboxylase